MARRPAFADAKESLLAELGVLARNRARSKIKSATLRDALEIELQPVSSAVVVGVPHYWAIYYHDGRGPVRAAPGKFLVYFKDPAEDPRLKAGYPVRATDIVHLSREQFLEHLAADRLIVTRSVGPADPHPFFTRGMDGFQEKVHAPAKRFMATILSDFIGKPEKDQTKIRLK